MDEPKYERYKLIVKVVVAVIAAGASIVVAILNLPVRNNPTSSQNVMNNGQIGTLQQSIINNLAPEEPNPDTKEGALKQLNNRGLPFSAAAFAHAVGFENSDVVELYLRAGMSANAVIPGSSFYVIWSAVRNSPDLENVLRVLLKHGLQPTLAASNQRAYSPPLLTMADQAYAAAYFDIKKIRMLKKFGLRPDGLISGYKNLCQLYRQNGDFFGQPNTPAERIAGLNRFLIVLRDGGVSDFMCR